MILSLPNFATDSRLSYLVILHYDLGESAPLHVAIEGTEITEACNSENITYTCNVAPAGHLWTAPGLLPINSFVTAGSVDVFTPRYTLRRVSADNSSIVSMLTVLSYPDFNNTNVACADILQPTIVQETLSIVLGESSYKLIVACSNTLYLVLCGNGSSLVPRLTWGKEGLL